MGILTPLAALLALALPAAAQNTWTGGASGDWHAAANWSAGVPVAGDTVLIDADALVVAYATNPAVSLAGLTLGDGAGAFAPVLRLSAGASLGALTLHRRGALQLDTTDLMSAADVFLAPGSSIAALSAASSGGGGAVRFSVTGTFSVSAGATVTALGRGYAPGTGPGAGSPGSGTAAGGGAGHGAAGGAGAGASAGGAAYGLVSSARLAGSGGGSTPSSAGGAGGGVVDIAASTIDARGLITADGEPGEPLGLQGGGGGAGGSIRLAASVLTGGGTLSARGGKGANGASYGGGGGAGGRIEMRLSDGDLAASSATHRVTGGLLGAGPAPGGAGGDGTDFATPRHWTGDALDGLASNGANWLPGLAPRSGERLVWGAAPLSRNASWDLPDVAVGSVAVLGSYSASVTLLSSMSVTGLFSMAGGTFAASAGRALELRGDASQTGGTLDLVGSTVVLRGGSYALADAHATALVVGGSGAATATLSGFVDCRAAVELSAGAHLALGGGTLQLSAAAGPFAGPGTVAGSPGHLTEANGSLAQSWSPFPGTLGGLRVSNGSGSGLRLSTASGTEFRFEGGVSVDTASVLVASGALVRVGGDWNAYGPAYLLRSTVSFEPAGGSTASVYAGGGTFDSLQVAASADAVTRFSTQVVLGSTMTVLSGTLDLDLSTVIVRGGWTESPGTRVRGGSSKAIFNGAGWFTVTQLGGSSFGAFQSSPTLGLSLSSVTTTLSNFEWLRGRLDIAGRELYVGGDLLSQSTSTLSAFLSTVTLNGSGLQVTNFPTLHGLIVDNRSAAGFRLNVNLSVSSFTVRPGAVFDGFSRALTVTGSVWDTADAVYNALPQAHSVSLNPSGTLYVSSGSVFNGKVVLQNNKTLQLAGDLTVQGPGHFLQPRPGSVILNAPGGSTITFKGSSDLIPINGAWTYAGNIADSWLVFEGSGLARGQSMSTNTIGSLRVSLGASSDTYRAADLNISRHLVVEGGAFKPNGARVISLGGDLIQTASGVVSFASTGTLRLNGPSAQALRLIASSHTLQFVTLQSSGAVTAGSALTVQGDFVVASGTFNAVAGVHSFQGSRVVVATGAYFDGGTSTAAFEGSLNGRTFTGVSFHGPTQLNGVVVLVSSVAFQTSSTMSALTAAFAGSTVAVAAGARLRVGSLRVDPGGGARIRLRSMTSGLPWQLELVTVSSVTGCFVSDSNASPGLTVRADDGRCSDGGGNSNWDFAPQLLTLFPGETLTPGVAPGKTGVPDTLVAGSTYAVSVQAISSRFDPVSVSSPVALFTDDPFASIPASLTLTGGATGFAYSPRKAEPSPLSSVVSAAASFGSGGSTVTVVPDALERLQLILPGELAAPGRPSGKTGTPTARVLQVPFSISVRAVDRYANLVSSVTHATLLASSASSSTLPGALPLVAGARVFTGLTLHVTGLFTLSATDLSEPQVAAGTSAVFGVSPPSLSSPTAAFHVPTGARVTTLGGSVSGTAQDPSSVERVTLDLLDASAGLHYDWNAGAFTSAVPVFATATLASPLEPGTTWHAAAPDAAFVSGRRYVFSLTVDNPSGLSGAASSTFTFDLSTLDYGLKNGQGTATVSPASTAGCRVLLATVTYTAGASGIAPGGAVAVRAPEGWTVAAGTSAANPPALGYWHAASTSAAFPAARLTVSPPSLGPGWLLLEASTASAQSFLPGQRVLFTYAGLAPLSPGGRGRQTFPLLARGEASGELLAISSFPVMTLTAGAEPVVVFDDPSPLSLAPLQRSPTMQLTLEDRCGNPLAGLSSGTVNLSLLAANPGGTVPDATAEIFGSTGGLVSSVFLSTGFAYSPPFTVRTATQGPPGLLLRGAGLFGTVPVEAVRLVRLTTSPLSFTDVAAGTAPLPSGTTSAVLSELDPQGVPGRVAFRLAAPEAEWELLLSTDAEGFRSPVLRATGRGEAGKTFVVSWDGVDRVSDPPRYAAPGRYKARLRADGTAEDRSVELVVPPGAGFTGHLGERGGGASVRAYGPGAQDGAFTVASSTGWFLLRGVSPGQAYRLSATTVASAGGRLVALSTTVLTGPAAAPWLDLGALALPATGLLRVSVASPVPAPRELVGSFLVRAADGSVGASGPLRFSSGSAVSDDAGPLFGRTASTWSAVAVAAGDWSLEAELPELRLSTAVPVRVAADGLTEARLFPPKRGAVLGWAVLPSTASGGTVVSVDARRDGDEEPSAAGSVFVSSVPVPVVASSGAIRLYGLDPGTYTVTASAAGFTPASAAVYVSTGADAPVLLRLGEGSALAGSLRVTGDSRALGSVFDAVVEARAEGRLETARTTVRLGASATLSSGPYVLAGLSTGPWTVSARLEGFVQVPSTGSRASAPGGPALELVPAQGRLRLALQVPPPPGGGCRPAAFYRGVGLAVEGSDAAVRLYPDITLLSTDGASAALHCSSATVLSPVLPAGRARVWAGLLDTGARAFGGTVLSPGATAALSLSLDLATVTLSGRVALTSELTLSSRTAGGVNFTVSLSSAAGLNAWSPGPGPVLIGSTTPTPVGGFRVELRPVDPEGRVSTAAALASGVLADGSYHFAGVSAGAWRLRIPGELDGRADDGEEAASVETPVSVGAAPLSVDLRFGRGTTLSGRVSAPAGTRLTRRLRVRLSAESGEARVADAAFSESDSAPFSFFGLTPGRWRVSVEDPGRPAVWTAAPRLLELGAAGLSGLDLRLESAGSIMGRLALGRTRPDGTRERVLLTAESAELLPEGFAIVARALAPGWGAWTADAGLDADGRFLVAGLPAGLYELSLTAPSGLAPATLSGIAVAAGRAVDPGVITLRRAVAAGGRVTDSSTGLPAAGVAVSARPSSRSSPAARTVTDAAGLWSLETLDPDERWYDLTAAPRGPESAADAPAPYAPRRLLGVDASTGVAADFALAPAASTLRGRVTTPDSGALSSSRGPGDASAPGAVVTLQRAGLPPEEDALADLLYRTSPDGRFAIPSLATGSYRLVVSAEGYGSLARAVSISTAVADLGELLLPGGCVVAGALRRPDGAPPSEAEVRAVAAATPDLGEFVWGSVSREGSGAGVSYRVGGLRTGRAYRLLLFTGEDEPVVPPGASALVFTSSAEVRALDAVVRPPRPSVAASAARAAGRVSVSFLFSRPLRARTPADLDPSLVASRQAGAGLLSGARLSADRRTLTVDYDPAPGEGSFTLRARAAVEEADPDSSDTVFPELMADAAADFRADVDAQQRSVVPNALGGAIAAGGGAARVLLPRGAFAVDASSTVALTLTRSTFNPAGAAPAGGVAPASPFLDIALPAGVPAALSRPARLVLPFTPGTDPSSLNLYWYNPGSGAFVLSPDALGAAPEADAAAGTYAVNVGHFSTFVLLPSGAAVIGGSAHSAAFEAYAFPNPFDLRPKTLTTIHGGGSPVVRGTMLRVAVPPGGGGAGRLRIFDAAGRLVRDLDLGDLPSGSNTYTDWDGRDSSGRDVASGAYLAVVSVGGKAKTVKLAVLK